MSKGTRALAGHLGNLAADEERKLQETWAHLLRLSGVDGNHPTPEKAHQHQENLDSDSFAGFRAALWGLFLADHPDVTVLRFLRARNWDVDRALEMITSTIHWRHQRRIDADVVTKGDSIALSQNQSKQDREFIAQFRSGKAYVRGVDKHGRPVIVIKVRLHDTKAQSNEAMERFVLLSIETVRAMMRHPHETVCLIFDLTGFGMKNMDFHLVKFLTETFEARYPEHLGVVLVHNAPFLFWGMWKVIKPWLDPAIAAKVNFTNGDKSLLEFVDREKLPVNYGGQDTWEYEYIPPTSAENERMLSEKKNAVCAEREELVRRFESVTLEWAGVGGALERGKIMAEERDRLAGELAESFWRLDPYVRARTYYHRAGVTDEVGRVDYRAAR